MILVQECSLNPGTNEAKISAFADTKEEVTEDATFVGLPKDVTIAPGSMILTANADVAFRRSDSTWNWV